MNNKIKTRQEISVIAAKLKKQGKRIATINGSFDILHRGHVSLLKKAKAKGDVLILLLNSDKSIKSYKGPNRPIIGEKDRAETLAALEYVDYAVIFNEINPKAILQIIKPAVHCNGSDWGKNCVERATVEKNGGSICVLKLEKNYSTSGIIKKIIKVYAQQPTARAVFIDRDGTINLNKTGYIHKIKDFEYAPGVVAAMKKLSASDYKIIIATNQSGIGRGYYKLADFYKLNNWLLKDLKKRGVRIDKVYFCPHGPNDNCACRKPAIGMLMEAVKDLGVSLSSSWIIGDDERDVAMGREANLKTIKIGGKIVGLKLQPKFYARGLDEAVKIILSEGLEQGF